MAFGVYYESWRMNDIICGTYSNVRMDECYEGETTSGYRSLAWYTLAMGACALAAVFCMLPGFKRGVALSSRISPLIRCPLLICPLLSLLLGLGLYAYFLTMIAFTSSIGDRTTLPAPDFPTGELVEWQFSAPERVLVFFVVGTGLWTFTSLAHMVEFVTARCVALRYIRASRDSTFASMCKAAYHMLRYRFGSILFAAFLVPLFRLPRGLILALKKGRKSAVFGVVVKPVMKRCWFLRAFYNRWLKYMTSDGLAWEAIKGGAFISSAVHGHVILKRHKRMNVLSTLNTANYSIWAYQLAVTMLGPVFAVYYTLFVVNSFSGVRNREITSVTALGFYMLAGSWMQAQIVGSFLRGALHGGVMAFLMDIDMNPVTDRDVGSSLLRFFNSQQGFDEGGSEYGGESDRDLKRVRPLSEVELHVPPKAGDLGEDSFQQLKQPPRRRTVPPPSRQAEETIAAPGPAQAISFGEGRKDGEEKGEV